MREKLIIAANKAIDRMNDLIPLENDVDKVRKTAETVLEACGFSSPKKPNGTSITNNTQINIAGNASAEVLARARERIGHEPLRLVQLPDPRPSCDTNGIESLAKQDSNGIISAGVGNDGGTLDSGMEICESGRTRESPRGDQTGDSGNQGINRQPLEELRAEGQSQGGTGESRSGSRDSAPDLFDAEGCLCSRGNDQRIVAATSPRVAVRLHGTHWDGVS